MPIIVSVIIPTKDSSATLKKCLDSIVGQTYKKIEVIVVDNNSSDNTLDIAKKYTEKIFNKGPERSAQVNYGVQKAEGVFIYKVDSDFVLEKKVIEECVEKVTKEGFDAVVVHNSPDVSVSWIARIRKFEVDMYKYDLTYSSARFIRKTVYEQIGGFNESVTAGEDYDFQSRLNSNGVRTGFIEAEAIHLGEPNSIWDHLGKYYSYGKDFVNYKQASSQAETNSQLGFFRPVYFHNWRKFLRHPLKGGSFILYHCAKYAAGSAGYIVGKLG